ncbi:MAG: hypothetical protein ABSB12_03745 [Candidatus Saccharimonadales bacterium]
MDKSEQSNSSYDPREFVIQLFDIDSEHISYNEEWLISTYIGIVRELQKTPSNPYGDGPLQISASRIDPKGRYDSFRVLGICQYEAAVAGFSIDSFNNEVDGEEKKQQILRVVAHTADEIRKMLTSGGFDINFFMVSTSYMDYIDMITEQREGPSEYTQSPRNIVMNRIRKLGLAKRKRDSEEE